MKNEQATVTVSIGDKEFSKEYTKVIFENSEDVLTALQKDEKEVVSLINYAKDLKLRANVRSQILTESAGPEKATNKAIEAFIKARAAVGKPVTEDEAKVILGL